MIDRSAVRQLTRAAILLLLSQPAMADCDQGDAIWALETDDGRAIFYYTDRGWWMGGNVRFEHWRGKQMVWRVAGEITCSNGLVVCFLDVPLSNGESITVPAEHYTEEGAKHASHMVFAHLAETTFRAQAYEEDPPRLVTEFADGSTYDPQNPPVLPSAFKFLACKNR